MVQYLKLTNLLKVDIILLNVQAEITIFIIPIVFNKMFSMLVIWCVMQYIYFPLANFQQWCTPYEYEMKGVNLSG